MAEQSRKRPKVAVSNAPPKKRSEEGKRTKKESDRKKQKSRIYIGHALERWRKVKEEKKLIADSDVANYLLDWFSTSHQTDGSVDKVVPHKSKRPLSVHPQDEERTPALLNDDVWVNLSCLLQLFQECGRCKGICTVNTQEDRSHFSVVQHCKACNHWFIWNSQPLEGTSTEKGENKEDVQITEMLVSLPCKNRQWRQKVTTGSEVKMKTEAWNEEHLVEVEVNIDSDFSDEIPLCRLEEKGGEEELGLQLDEMHEDDVGQIEKHHKDFKETDEFQTEEEDDWLGEEEQEGDSQRSDPDFEISKPIKRRPRMRKIFENENEGANKVTEDQEWQTEDEDEWSSEEEGDSQEESDPDFEMSKPRKRRFHLVRFPQQLCPNCGIVYASQTHKCDDKRRFPCPKRGKLQVSEQNLNAHIEELGQQLDEMHENEDGKIEKHHKNYKETEKQIESVGITVEVNGGNDKEDIDKVFEDDEGQCEDEEEVEEEVDSQESDSDIEISKPIKRPRTRKIFENENEGINKVTEDEEWPLSREEGGDLQEESDPDFEKSKPIKRPRMQYKKYYARRVTQRLCPNCGVMYVNDKHKCDKRRFPCPKCGKLCVSEQNLKVHRIFCERSVFPCRLCLKPFKTQLKKLNHENGHKDAEKLYLCSKCPETFADIYARNRHLKEHRLLTCQTCHKQFPMLNHLQRHELSHLDDKPFKCHVCERAFAQGSHLKSHMRVHTGERPYECQLCPMRFNHNISLKTHIRRHHQSESHLIGPQSHPDSGEQQVTPRGLSSALTSDPREQEESTHIPSSDKGLDPVQEPQPSRGSTEPGEVLNMTVQERGKGEVAESVLEDQEGLSLQTKLESAEREGGGNEYESRPKRKRQRNRWINSDFDTV